MKYLLYIVHEANQIIIATSQYYNEVESDLITELATAPKKYDTWAEAFTAAVAIQENWTKAGDEYTIKDKTTKQ